MKDPATNKTMPLDGKISKLRVSLDSDTYRSLNDVNARYHFNAKSLKQRLETMLDDFSNWLMDGFGIASHDLKKSIDYNFELNDTTGVRYLFYPRREIKHGDIYASFVGKKTDVITRTTGDLTILNELPFRNYEYSHGSSAITVRMEHDTVSKRKGFMAITRTSKDMTSLQRYMVFNSNDVLYVLVADILEALNTRRTTFTETPTLVKIDGLPPLPW